MGKVSNNDTINTVKTVTVNVQFFDRDDTLLGSNSDGTYSLALGQTWSFKISASPEIIENQPINAIDHYQITARGFKPLQ
ncbi:MAG: FxLYD domain-containing protein [Nitrososphaeraceae archaeon]